MEQPLCSGQGPEGSFSMKYASLRGKEALLTELWENGLNDCEIARKLGCSDSAVFQWRRRKGLPRNCERGRPPDVL